MNDNTGHVWVELQVKQGEISVSVIDNGCGIPEAELPLIFIRHYQGK